VAESAQQDVVDVPCPVVDEQRPSHGVGAVLRGGFCAVRRLYAALRRVFRPDPGWKRLYLSTVGMEFMLMLTPDHEYSQPKWVAFGVLIVLTHLAILFVRSHPLVVLTWELAVFLAAPHFGLDPYAGVIVALYFFCFASRLPAALAATVTVLAACDVIQYIYGSGLISFGRAMIALAIFPTGTFMAAQQVRAQVAARYAEQSRALEAELALREERLHLARETHDVLTHSVSMISLLAAGALNVFESDRDAARQALGDIRQIASRSAGELRSVVRRMRSEDVTGDPGGSRGLTDVPELVEFVRRSGREVALETSEPSWLCSPEQSRAAYRAVQEGLTNAVKHGVPGSAIRVRMRWSPTWFRAEVESQSLTAMVEEPAFASSGHGLRGIGERVAAAGGQFEASRSGQRFRLQATFFPAPGPEEPGFGGRDAARWVEPALDLGNAGEVVLPDERTLEHHQ